jgi:hypothetical protein
MTILLIKIKTTFVTKILGSDLVVLMAQFGIQTSSMSRKFMQYSQLRIIKQSPFILWSTL